MTIPTWIDEAERRLAAFRRGEVQGIPVDEVLGEMSLVVQRHPQSGPTGRDNLTERKSK